MNFLKLMTETKWQVQEVIYIKDSTSGNIIFNLKKAKERILEGKCDGDHLTCRRMGINSVNFCLEFYLP